MAAARIKEEYKTAVVAFGTSGLPLGARDDLDELAIMALESGDNTLLVLFEELPTLQALKQAKVEKELSLLFPERTIVTENNNEESDQRYKNESNQKGKWRDKAGTGN